jgi:F0F1-type ATP synthase assembly protein I
MGRTFSERWAKVREELRLGDLCVDVLGKVLVGVGLGALWAQVIQPVAWGLIAVGAVLMVIVKAKYWKRFWS